MSAVDVVSAMQKKTKSNTIIQPGDNYGYKKMEKAVKIALFTKLADFLHFSIKLS